MAVGEGGGGRGGGGGVGGKLGRGGRGRSFVHGRPPQVTGPLKQVADEISVDRTTEPVVNLLDH